MTAQSSQDIATPRGSAPAAAMMEGAALTPYWWQDAGCPQVADTPLPAKVDVAIVGSGYTGLNAALPIARAGRSVLVLEAQTLGWGCSTRNGGQISTSIKPDVPELERRYGADRARAIDREGYAALDWVETLVKGEAIDCDFRRCGRFHAAHTPEQYEKLARRVADRADDTHEEGFAVPRAGQRAEIGTDLYHGGIVLTRHAAVQPAKYHAGLARVVLAAGATVVQHCPVLGIRRDGERFTVTTPRGTVSAKDVVVATNGYTEYLIPWISRRIIPIGSYIIATEELPADLIEQLIPKNRIVSDTRRVIYYYRASPDRRRIIFGGRVSAREADTRITGPRLHRDMVELFPELAGTRVSHSWMGTVAYSFDHLAHTGVHDGIHYALSYCGSGVSMASYLGMRVGHRVLGHSEGRTGFDDLPFPTRPLYSGKPWFLPAVVAWYRWLDQRDCRKAAKSLSARTKDAA